MKLMKAVFLSVIAMTIAWFVMPDRRSSAQTADVLQATQDAAASLQASMPTTGVVALPGLKIDLTNRTVIVEAEVCLRDGPLEFVLCKSGTKDHESLLRTKVLPSHVHAALLALGLAPGKPVKFIPGDETWPGKILPPKGPGLDINLKWKDDKGQEVTANVAKWLAEAQGKPIKEINKWVFVGSELMPDGYYLADENGEIISSSNFATSVIDVPFESSANNADRIFIANTKEIPAGGTQVSVVITPQKDAEKSPDARVCLDVDRLGRMIIDGELITMDQLTDWGYKFIEKHDRGQVVIRIDGNAKVWLTQVIKEKLMIGGVRDFDYRYYPPSLDMLPMTKDQVSKAMEVWREKFKNPQDYIIKPDVMSEWVTDQIDGEIEQADAIKELWKEYRKQIQEERAKYMATSRASSKPVESQ